jgi:hypothetical protein
MEVLYRLSYVGAGYIVQGAKSSASMIAPRVCESQSADRGPTSAFARLMRAPFPVDDFSSLRCLHLASCAQS